MVLIHRVQTQRTFFFIIKLEEKKIRRMNSIKRIQAENTLLIKNKQKSP